MEVHSAERLLRILFGELPELLWRRNQSRLAVRVFVFAIALLQVLLEALRSPISPGFFRLRSSEFQRAQGGIVQGIGRHPDHIIGSHSLWQLDLPFLPEKRDVAYPSLAHPSNEGVWPTKQKHLRAKCIPPCQHGQILQDNRV